MSYRTLSKLFVVLCPLILTGCGFQPLYSGDPCHHQAFDLHIKGNGYSTYKFRREMEKQLAIIPKFDNEDYQLKMTVSEVRTVAAQQHDASVTRKLSTLNAVCVISKKVILPGTNRPHYTPITTSSVSVTSSYPITPRDEYVSRVAETAASTRTAITLAQDSVRDILKLIKERSNGLP